MKGEISKGCMVLTAGVEALTVFVFWKVWNQSYETANVWVYDNGPELLGYFLYALTCALLFKMVQTKIRSMAGTMVLAVVTAVFATVQAFLFNNLLHCLWIFRDYVKEWDGRVEVYLNSLKKDLHYEYGLGLWRYVLFALLVFGLCMMLAGKRSKPRTI